MAIRNYRDGGFVTDTPTDIINLYASMINTLQFSTFRKSGTSVGYQVTAGKQFYISSLRISYGDDTGSNIGIALGYADNDLGIDSTTARTNPVPIMGNPESGSNSQMGVWWDGTGVGPLNTMMLVVKDLIWKAAPAGKYMYFMKSAGTHTSVLMTGFEV